jgi:AcrR family transcriptional regulator
MSLGEHGRQVRKTRAGLLDAFRELVLERRYADIRVSDILRRADVGRSTFYEHFRNKDDVLRQSLSGLLTIVADAVGESCDLRRLQLALDHFRENSGLARGLLNGPSSRQVVLVLAGLIEERFAVLSQPSGRDPVVPPGLAAAHVAEGLFGLVRAWLNQGARCSSEAIARAMHTSAAASARALFTS